MITTDQQDIQDMTRLAAGHDAALNELMARHSLPLFHYLIRQLQNETDAEEIAQETFVRVYQHRAKFQVGKKFSTWLYTIATNLVRDRFRFRHPQVSLDAEAPGENPLSNTLSAPQSSPGENMEAEERAEAIRSAVASLPEELRLPLVLAEYEQKSQAEIAAILQCTVKAVETRIYRARRQLREQLAALRG